MRGRDTCTHKKNPRKSGSRMDVVWGCDAQTGAAKWKFKGKARTLKSLDDFTNFSTA